MELVKVNQNKVFADSRIIAENFNKAHRQVLQSIDNLIENLNETDAEKSATLFINLLE